MIAPTPKPPWNRPPYPDMGTPPTPMPMPRFGCDPMGDMMPQEDFHGIMSIQFCELFRWGFIVWGEPSWAWDYYDEKQYWRVCEKLENHYWQREIGVLPPGAWKMEFMRRMNEIMPKYKLAYKALDDGVSLMRTEDTYGKTRDVDSEFPATQLSENNDYASNASDREFETLHEGDYLDRVEKLQAYNDIDLQIVNDMETMFSCLLTSHMNGGMGL